MSSARILKCCHTNIYNLSYSKGSADLSIPCRVHLVMMEHDECWLSNQYTSSCKNAVKMFSFFRHWLNLHISNQIFLSVWLCGCMNTKSTIPTLFSSLQCCYGRPGWKKFLCYRHVLTMPTIDDFRKNIQSKTIHHKSENYELLPPHLRKITNMRNHDCNKICAKFISIDGQCAVGNKSDRKLPLNWYIYNDSKTDLSKPQSEAQWRYWLTCKLALTQTIASCLTLPRKHHLWEPTKPHKMLSR